MLGRFPLPVEVIPMAGAQVARRLRALGGEPRLRRGLVTDNGGHILDVRGLVITDPLRWRRDQPVARGRDGRPLRAQPGGVALLGTPDGVRTVQFEAAPR